MSYWTEDCYGVVALARSYLLGGRQFAYGSVDPGSEMSDPLIGRRSRYIRVNQSPQPEKFCSNVISTCKYSPLSFLPRFLIEQFRRYNNVFFLVIALLQQIPDVSPTGRYNTLFPFLIILSVSALKEIFEDIKRRRSDQTVNNFWAKVLKGRAWVPTRWRKVEVGNIVRVENGQLFPGDLVLLSSSEPNAMAYIETSNLDGETNLKIRQGLQCTSHAVNIVDIEQLHCEIECEQPNRHVNEFTGTLQIRDEKRPLGVSQVLLRGARLKNTQWICGAVIYTGHDAKLLMNSKTAPLKRSNVDTMTNRRIIFLFFILITLAIASAVGAHYYESDLHSKAAYLGLSGSRATNFLYNVLTFFILYNNLIPISLQVTLEVVRVFQAAYINNDSKMYDEHSDTCAIARTSNLNEELGQVKFVLSDKTGTLTRNVMKFKRCSVAGVTYGNDEDEEFHDQTLIDDIHNFNKEESDLLLYFLRMMAVCHTVVPERDEDDKLRYQASSPDEGALVRGAAAMGFVFHTRKPELLVIDALDNEEVYELLNVLEFTSDRKRMGVVVRCPDGNIRLFVKGADSVILERLKPKSRFVNECLIHLSEFASKGYRTLCLAMRTVDEKEYEEWAADFHAASISLEEREAKLAACAERIEKELTLVGASAIEDKLQENVPETIRSLMEAEIRVWILTGDKRETAINIAHASALLTSGTTTLLIDTQTYDETYARLSLFVDKTRDFQRSQFALIIDGTSLHYTLTGECRQRMCVLALRCRAVVCCRMSPMQKADVVELVRSSGDHVVLAIGDGANDVAMIQAANVGVGISGEEGLQAASASDYAIGQFQFLQRLLLVHGAWNFDRSVKVILYSFYKNICLYLIELWFALYSAFSGQTVFERWTIAFFNLLFTSLPPVFLGLFDRPASDTVMLTCPGLYFSFQKRAFSIAQFGLWVGMAVWHSILLYFLSYGFLYRDVIWPSGRAGGWLVLGNSCYSFVVATVCLKALLECDSWTWITVLSCVGSFVFWFAVIAVYSLTFPTIPLGSDMTGQFYMMASSYTFWLALILIPTLTLMTDFVIKAIRGVFFRTPKDYACLYDKWLHQQGPDVSVEWKAEIPEGRHLQGITNAAAVYGSMTELSVVPSSAAAETRMEEGGLAGGGAGAGGQGLEGGGQASGGPQGNAARCSYLKPFIENARLLESMENDRNEVIERPGSISPVTDSNVERGYAFSQEERGVVSQGEMIRTYDSTSSKPRGV